MKHKYSSGHSKGNVRVFFLSSVIVFLSHWIIFSCHQQVLSSSSEISFLLIGKSHKYYYSGCCTELMNIYWKSSFLDELQRFSEGCIWQWTNNAKEIELFNKTLHLLLTSLLRKYMKRYSAIQFVQKKLFWGNILSINSFFQKNQ